MSKIVGRLTETTQMLKGYRLLRAYARLAMTESSERREKEARVEDRKTHTCDTDHPAAVSKVFRRVVRVSTYIPSSSKNSVSLRINGFPQPPAISGRR
jgi:hypothetical protein